MSHWPTTRLRYIADLNPAVRQELLKTPETEVSFLPMEAIGEDGSLSLERTRPVSEVRNGYSYFEDGDVAFAKVTPCFENGKGALMSGLIGAAGFGTTELTVLRPKQGTAPQFLHYVVQSSLFRLLGAAAMTGAGGLKRVPDEFTRDFTTPWPSLVEQTRIANFLDEQTARIDALIAEKERLVSTIEEYWRSYLYSSMQSAACLGLELPHEGWALEPVKRVCASIQTGRTPSGARDDCFTEDGVPWVTPGDMDDIFVKSSGKSVSYVALHDGEVVLYPPGSTLLVGIGATLGTVSNARVAVSANQQINILVPDPRKIDALFLTFAIKANQDQVRLSAGAATLPILNQERTGRLKIAIPRMEQQIATRNQLLRLRENANRLLSHVGRHLSILREYRSSLISAAVTGQLDIDNFGRGAA